MSTDLNNSGNREVSFFSLLIIVAIIVAVGFLISSLFSNSRTVAEQPDTPFTSNDQDSEKDRGYIAIQSQDGVDIIVEAILAKNDRTTVTVSMTNHMYDLSDPSVQDRSSFGGQPVITYTVLSTQMGGHHVESELVFSGSPNGDLIISPTPELSFTFSDL